LLQSIEVLAVDQRLDAPADNKNNVKDLGSVTLLVTPDQAALLDLGQNLGQLSLSLRNLSDTKSASASTAKITDIVSGTTAKSGMMDMLQQWAAQRAPKAPHKNRESERTERTEAQAPPQPNYLHVMAYHGVQQEDIRIPAGTERR
jgi:Flp pilus assembly protein CpaB